MFLTSPYSVTRSATDSSRHRRAPLPGCPAAAEPRGAWLFLESGACEQKCFMPRPESWSRSLHPRPVLASPCPRALGFHPSLWLLSEVR